MSKLEHWSSELADDRATEEESALLRAARGVGPSDASRARIGAAIGVGLVTASIAPTAAKVPFSLAKWLAGKWLFVGITGAVTVVSVGAAVKLGTSQPSAPVVVASASVAETRPIPPAEQTAAPASSDSAPAIDPPPAPASTPAPATVRVPAVPAVSAAHASTFDEQLALLESAKRSLDQNQPQAALDAADAYTRQNPDGTFIAEAEVIRIEALAEANRRPEAEAAARAFLARRPTSVQAARVRSLLHNLEAKD